MFWIEKRGFWLYARTTSCRSNLDVLIEVNSWKKAASLFSVNVKRGDAPQKKKTKQKITTGKDFWNIIGLSRITFSSKVKNAFHTFKKVWIFLSRLGLDINVVAFKRQENLYCQTFVPNIYLRSDLYHFKI